MRRTQLKLTSPSIKLILLIIPFTQGWTDCLFHKEILLPELQTSSPPVFNNGTTFSNPFKLKTAAVSIPVTYTNNPLIAERWLNDNIPLIGEFSILGFDVESVPVTPWFKNKVSFEGPATVQFATPTNCLVIHLTRRFGENDCSCLHVIEKVLKDESIIKAGVGVNDDMIELYRLNKKLQAKSRFDLGGIASTSPGRRTGLKTLTKALLGVHLKKSRKLAMSNWSKPLTDAQIHYCARDAWAGAAIFMSLEDVYPDLFSTKSMNDFFVNERSISEINKRSIIRSSSKNALKSIMREYKEYTLLFPSKTHNFELSPGVKREVEKLQLMIKSNAPESIPFFDEDMLGFSHTRY